MERMAEVTASEKQTVWKFFLWWYRESYLLSKGERTLYLRLKPKENRMARQRFTHAFLLNGVMHTGLGLVMWTGAVSKKYSFPFLSFIPFPLRLGLTLTVPPVLAYLRFQDIFYEKELCALALHWASSEAKSVD